MIVTMKEILDRAQTGGYGVVAPNIFNETTIRGAVEAAVELETPLILDALYADNPDLITLSKFVYELARDVKIPVALNQDHGATFAEAIRAIQANFTSIMVDRSQLPLEENIAQVSELVRIAHTVNVSVESELGHVGSGSNYEAERDAGLTDPEVAKEFVDRTGVDCLAVAVGTAHGAYTGEPHLDFERLRAIRAKVSVPLVLHGGSGTGEENLRRAAKEGVTKINISTDLLRAGVENAQNATLYTYYNAMREGYKEKLKYYMGLTGQIGKAW